MVANAHPSTLFHLVPTNKVAHDALYHPDNQRFVSFSRNGSLGLEVGYHVSSKPQGHVITRLGRNADLILRQSTPQCPMSATHVTFQMNPTTNVVCLSVRSRRLSSVKFGVLQENDSTRKEGYFTGDGVILYEQDYDISIASYDFRLIWRTVFDVQEANICSLKALAIQGYHASLRLLQNMRSRDRPTEYGVSEAPERRMTRVRPAKYPVLEDTPGSRSKIGSGTFGTVYSALDMTSGDRIAIKVVNLGAYSGGNLEKARAMLHREIKVMERVKHVSYLFL